MKYIFVTGGVVSGLGKGITAASLGRLLKARGLSVTMKKVDPYLNVDPGTMNPLQHGEVFVTHDGAETDLDLGHYERFIDENLNHTSSISSGKVYAAVLENERRGDYHGGTVQVIPHITNEFMRRIRVADENTDVVLIEIGGTIGDIEGLPIVEAVRQFAVAQGRENCLFIHVTLVPYLSASHEHKSKPTQHSVRELLSHGIQPDIIVTRTESPIDAASKTKIALFCNVPTANVIENLNLPSLYDVPQALANQSLDALVCKRLGLETSEPDMSEWDKMTEAMSSPVDKVRIAIVGKYTALVDAYLSIIEALTHGGLPTRTEVDIKWIDAERVTSERVEELFDGIDGILVPGGFGERGIEGKIEAATYARTHNIPFFGICLGMQITVVEFARNVLGYKEANSSEFAPKTSHPVIDLMAEQGNVMMLGGTMRLGAYPCVLKTDSKVANLYNAETIYERHRHRYEFNNAYRLEMEAAGLIVSGTSPDGTLVEVVELKEHPFMIGAQFHPEFLSRPTRPHPLFVGFVTAALGRKNYN